MFNPALLAATKPQKPFTLLVNTANSGYTNSTQFALVGRGTGYDFNVNWGDGTIENLRDSDSIYVDGSQEGELRGWLHNYSTAGSYEVQVSGYFPRFQVGPEFTKLVEVRQWGDMPWDRMVNSFLNTSNMQIVGSALTIPPNTWQTLDWDQAFRGCGSNYYPPFDTKNATNLSRFFYLSNVIEAPWLDTSNNTNFHNFFRSCTQLVAIPTTKYDISSALITYRMFRNTPLLPYTEAMNLDTSNVQDMESMYADRPLQYIIPPLFNTSGYNGSDVWDQNTIFNYSASVFAGNTHELGILQTGNPGGLLSANGTFPSVLNVQQFFRSNPNLTTVDVSFPDATRIDNMFQNCTSLTTLTLSAPNAVNYSGFITNCPALTSATITLKPDSVLGSLLVINGYTNLTSLLLPGYALDTIVINCGLDRTAINNLVASLATISSGSRTLLAYGNTGSASVTAGDISTALAKGWILNVTTPSTLPTVSVNYSALSGIPNSTRNNVYYGYALPVLMAGGNSNQLIRSTDSGSTWSIAGATLTSPSLSVVTVNKSNPLKVLAWGSNGIVADTLLSTDGFATRTNITAAISTGSGIFFTTSAFWDNDTLLVAGYDGGLSPLGPLVVRISTNNGSTWSTETFGIATTDAKTVLLVEDNLWLVSTPQGLRRSTNNGTSWTLNAASGLNNIFITRRSSTGRLFGIGNQQRTYYSDNNGVSWTQAGVPVDTGRSIRSISFNGNNVVALSTGFTNINAILLYSPDNGVTWYQNQISNLDISGIQLTSALSGFILGKEYTGGAAGVAKNLSFTIVP